jgi:hypothetical protein
MTSRNTKPLTALACAAVLVLLQALPAGAGLLVNFPFDEGTGKTTTDTVTGAVGWFGYQNPVTDQVSLINNSPSGAAGDRSINITGRAFLLADDSNGPILNITNSPITLETWLYLDASSVAKSSEGLVGYGQSYKMGMKGGWQVFTLLGIKDITNSSTPVPAGQWTHLAAAWEPGVGVHFYIDGVHTLVADANLSLRAAQHNLLTIGSESPTNGVNCVCAMDRVRVHNALLDATQLDSDAANPKPVLASTLVAYNFNEAAFPCQNAKAPARPTIVSTDFYRNTALPVWTNDTPTGLPSDHALAFNMGTTALEMDRVNLEAPTLDLRGADGMTNYTFEAWVKLPTTLINDREVLFRTYGPAPRISVSIDLKRNLHTTVWGSADYASSVIIPNDQRWHHIAIAMVARTTVQFYLDGVLGPTMPGNSKAATGDTLTGFVIGQENNSRYFRGLMDRVRVWDSALSANQLDFPAIPGQAVVTTQPTNIVADVGGTAQFITAVSSTSGATYQWFYKTNLESTTSVAVPNATSTTLTLNNVTADKQGFYFVRISNAAGATESYGAQLAVRSGPQFDTQGFEAPKYVTEAFESQDLWTVDQNAGTYTVQTASQIAQALTSIGFTPGQTVHSGSQAVLIAGAGGASVAVRPVLGFENQSNVTLDFWARPLTGGTTALTNGNMFITLENSAGTRAAAVRFGYSGSSRSIDYNSGNAWVATGLTWDDQTWYRFTMQLDYASHKYDVFVNGTKINASPIPFYYATSDKFQQLRIYRGANQAGMILDDMTASVPLRLSTPTVANGTVTLSWQGGLAPYQIQRRASLATGQWENVGSPTSAMQGTDTAAAGSMFYRVVGK